MQKEQLNKHFVEWFYNSNWVENYNRNGWMRDHFDNRDADQRHYWMLESFMAGYELWQRLEQQEWDELFDNLEPPQQQPDPWPFPGDTATIQTTQFATKAAWPFPEDNK